MIITKVFACWAMLEQSDRLMENEGVFKKAVQQGRSFFGERSVQKYVSTTKKRERRWRFFSTPLEERILMCGY